MFWNKLGFSLMRKVFGVIFCVWRVDGLVLALPKAPAWGNWTRKSSSKRPLFLSSATPAPLEQPAVPKELSGGHPMNKSIDSAEIVHETLRYSFWTCMTLNALQMVGVLPRLDLPLQVAANTVVTGGGAVAAWSTLFGDHRKRILKEVQRRIYDTAESDEWSGSESLRSSVTAHVLENPNDKTAVLIDPSGKIKRQLLDNMFRGQKSIIAPKMKKLSLDEDMSMYLGLKAADFLGLDELGRLMKDVTKPPRFPLDHFISRSTTRPFVCIVDVPKVATEKEVVVILRDASMLQEAGGKSVITVACLRKTYGIFKRPLAIDEFKFSVVS